MSFSSRLKAPLLTALAMLVMVIVRVFYGSVVELREGQRAIQEKDPDRAIVHLERSLHWYVPLSPIVDQAAVALWTLGQAAEGEGNTARALEAYQALRGAFYATRSFYTPHPEWIERADERIASIQASDRLAQWPDPKLSEQERKSIALKTLQGDDAPSPGWSAVSVIGFAAWVAAALGFIFRAFAPDGKFIRREGLRWGAVVVAGYALWVIGLMRA